MDNIFLGVDSHKRLNIKTLSEKIYLARKKKTR
jgi:hypothetical protein